MSEPIQANISGATDAAVLIAQLQQKLSSYEQQITVQAEQLTRKDQALQLAELKIRALEERLRLERIARYGKRSEKLSDLQLQLLDLEPGVSSEEVEAESQRDPLTPDRNNDTSKPKRRNQNHPGRNQLPEHLERVSKVIACTPEQCICGQCGNQTKVIGYEETEVLEVKPAEYFVQVTRREKRACGQCEQQGVQTAAVPERIMPKSLLSDQVIIDLVVNKYCDAQPLYRQQDRLRRDAGVDIAYSTMNDGVMRVGDLLIPVVGVMRRELLDGGYIQADETPVGVQTHDKRGRNHQGYMWQYGSPGKDAVFDFQMGRDHKGPKKWLGPFCGLLQTDGYKAYDTVVRDKTTGAVMIHACCWAHVRRMFVDAVKVNAKDVESAQVVTAMDELFAIDREAREQKMTHAERDGLRQERAPALMDKLRTQMIAIQKTALPKSVAYRAANYTLARWKELTVFLKHPILELSNNQAENSMRKVAIGRKNWLHLGHKDAGPRIAAIFSIVESCRRRNIPVRQYLANILPGLANRSIHDLDQLTPAAYAARATM